MKQHEGRYAAMKENALIVIGQALMPLKAAVLETVTGALKWFQNLGEGSRRSMLMAGVAIAAVVSGLALFGPAALLVGGAIAALKLAYDHNLGGIADTVQRVAAKVKLGARALFEIFSRGGGLSRGLLRELNTAENVGLKNFVIKVYTSAQLVGHIFQSIGQGIQSGIAAMQPTIDRVGQAFDYLAVTLGLTSNNSEEAKSSWERWGRIGKVVGEALTVPLEFGAKVIARLTEAAGGFMTKWPAIKEAMQPAIDAVQRIGAAIASVLEKMGLMKPGADSASNWQKIGRVIGEFATVAVKHISMVAGVIASIVEVFAGVIKWVVALVNGDWATVWDGVYTVVAGVMKALISAVTWGVTGITKPIDQLVQGLVSLGSKLGLDVSSLSGFNLTAGVEGLGDDLKTKIDEAKPKIEQGAAAVSSTAADTASLWAAQQKPTLDAFATSLKNLKVESKTTVSAPVTVVLDGEVIAQHINKTDGRETTTTVPND
jgi:hypothetical protein